MGQRHPHAPTHRCHQPTSHNNHGYPTVTHTTPPARTTTTRQPDAYTPTHPHTDTSTRTETRATGHPTRTAHRQGLTGGKAPVRLASPRLAYLTHRTHVHTHTPPPPPPPPPQQGWLGS